MQACQSCLCVDVFIMYIYACVGLSYCSFRQFGHARAFKLGTSDGEASRFLSYVRNHSFITMCFPGAWKHAKYFFCMKEEDKNKNLRSRRDFFKKAASTVLPFLGVVAMASAPKVNGVFPTITVR